MEGESPRTYVLRHPDHARGRLVQVLSVGEGYTVCNANSCLFEADGTLGPQTTIGSILPVLSFKDAVEDAENLVQDYLKHGFILVGTVVYPPREAMKHLESDGDIYLYSNAEIHLPEFRPLREFGS